MTRKKILSLVLAVTGASMALTVGTYAAAEHPSCDPLDYRLEERPCDALAACYGGTMPAHSECFDGTGAP